MQPALSRVPMAGVNAKHGRPGGTGSKKSGQQLSGGEGWPCKTGKQALGLPACAGELLLAVGQAPAFHTLGGCFTRELSWLSNFIP